MKKRVYEYEYDEDLINCEVEEEVDICQWSFLIRTGCGKFEEEQGNCTPHSLLPQVSNLI